MCAEVGARAVGCECGLPNVSGPDSPPNTPEHPFHPLQLRCSLRLVNLTGSLQVKRFPRFLEPRSRGVSQFLLPPMILRHTEAGRSRPAASRLRVRVCVGRSSSPASASAAFAFNSFWNEFSSLLFCLRLSSTRSRIERNVSSAIPVLPLSRPGGVAAAERPRSDPVEKPWSRPLP